jgi:RNA polymerase sigma-70 factor (ECF subfamily)
VDADEAALVARSQRGDRDAFAELMTRHASSVLTVAWRILGDRALAEDIAQDTFLAVFRALPRFRAEARFSTWVYRIAVNRCRDVLRARAADPVASAGAVDEGPTADEPAGESVLHRTPEQQLIDKQRDVQVADALQRLPPLYREAFVLKHVEGLSYDEMSEVLDADGSTLRMRVYKARQELSRALAGFALVHRRAQREGGLK